jgi:dynein heavy chain, axonemal
MFQDKVSDYRKAFSLWWQSEWKAVPFPEKGLVYDYYVKTDEEGNVGMAPWEDIVDTFKYQPDEPFGNMFVNTVETTRMKYFLNSFVKNRHYCMFVGNTGTSKTAIMMNVLRNMNSFSDAPSLQPTLESPLEKKSGVRFGPPGAKNLVYFIDDMNMPFVDKYDTQTAIEIVRQYVDYGGWYDKVKIVLKDIVNCQLMGAMNPTAGAFQITPRMQRHFVTFGIVVRVHILLFITRSFSELNRLFVKPKMLFVELE